MRLPAFLLLALSLACGGGRDPGPAVDAERGPPGGPRLGAPAPAAASGPSSYGDEHGDVFALGTSTELGIEMTTAVSVRAGVVAAARWSASTPGPDGSDLCWSVQEQLDARYGDSSSTGIPGLYPQRTWSGERVKVVWERTGEAGTTDYSCVVRWTLQPGELLVPPG